MDLGMASMSTANGALFTDLGHLAKLRNKAGENPQGALKEVAQQFESLFVQMMMKAMRFSGLWGNKKPSRLSLS